MNKIDSVENYINSFDANTHKLLKQIRETIRQVVPEAIESISYGMPAYKLNKKPLVYFAAYKNHIGFYATPQGHVEFSAELSKYKQGKGSVQFPINEPMPLDLIARITQFKVDSCKK